MNNNVFRILYLILIPLNLFIAFHAKFDILNFISALFMLICWGYIEWRITNERNRKDTTSERNFGIDIQEVE